MRQPKKGGPRQVASKEGPRPGRMSSSPHAALPSLWPQGKRMCPGIQVPFSREAGSLGRVSMVQEFPYPPPRPGAPGPGSRRAGGPGPGLQAGALHQRLPGRLPPAQGPQPLRDGQPESVSRSYTCTPLRDHPRGLPGCPERDT